MKKIKNNLLKFVISLMFILIILLFFGIVKNIPEQDGILEIKSVDKMYLALGEKTKLHLDIKYKEKGNPTIKYEIEDEDILSINEDILIAKKIGSTKININSIKNVSKSIEVIVINLITTPTYAQNKNELKCKVYTNEESEILDDILKTDIENAGYKTRAGVVAAARFLSLKFKHKINYFFENGRLAENNRKYIDGEGRYYHTGLYLSEDKYNGILASSSSPAIWGCDLYANYVKTYSRNGLNCSGFISWSMLNGGFDVGDIGAGITEFYDFTDMGEKTNITEKLLNSNQIKVGDLIGRDGHIAIIIGKENNKIYIAESYIPSLKVREFTYKELLNSDEFDYIMLMDEVYKKDGNISDMW